MERGTERTTRQATTAIEKMYANVTNLVFMEVIDYNRKDLERERKNESHVM